MINSNTSEGSQGYKSNSENWKEQKAKLKAKFSVLLDADLLFENGHKDEMLERICKKLGKTKEEMLAFLASI